MRENMDKDTIKEIMGFAHWANDGDPSILAWKKEYGRAYIASERGFDFYDDFLRWIVENYGWEAWEKMWEAPNGTRSDT